MDITMIKEKVQITIYKTLHRKQKVEQRNVTFATNINEILLIQLEFECITFLNMFNYILKFYEFHRKQEKYTIAYVLIFDRKSRRNCEQPGFMEKQWIPINAPPIGTSLPPEYSRGLSDVSLE